MHDFTGSTLFRLEDAEALFMYVLRETEYLILILRYILPILITQPFYTPLIPERS